MNEQVGLGDAVAFCRKYACRILLRGFVSLVAVVLVLMAYYAFAPRSEQYRTEVQVTLQSANGALVYPNKEAFGAHDIISAPVLNRIWKKYGFDAQGVEFRDFASWFSVAAYDKERAKVDAEFQSKMSKRNITVTELTAIQREYEEKLAMLSVNRFALSVRPERLLDRETAIRLLTEIPEIWYDEYATIKAPVIPAVASPDVIRSHAERIKGVKGRELELTDMLQQFIVDLTTTCKFVRDDLLRGRNARIGGVDLGVYESELPVMSDELLRLRLMLQRSGGAELKSYVMARLDSIACEALELDEKVKAVQQTIDLLADSRGAELKSGVGAGSDSTALTVQVDSGFFSDFKTMIRRDANQDLMRRYADELTNLRKNDAELAARKLYYEQIDKGIAAAAEAQTAADADKALDGLLQNLLDLGVKILGFRDQCLTLYRTSDQFYVVADPVSYAKSFKFRLPRIALGLLAVWALYNLLTLARLWHRE